MIIELKDKEKKVQFMNKKHPVLTVSLTKYFLLLGGKEFKKWKINKVNQEENEITIKLY